MHTEVAAWQMDIFDASPAPVTRVQAKPDPLPDPQYWSEAVTEKMVDALISLATDSRRGDNMPESLMDCAALFSERLKNRKKLDLDDYRATLGWVMEFWNGALPYRFVCQINGVDLEILQDVILSNPLLKRDMEEVRRDSFGTLL
jgi:hypothetical protein